MQSTPVSRDKYSVDQFDDSPSPKINTRTPHSCKLAGASSWSERYSGCRAGATCKPRVANTNCANPIASANPGANRPGFRRSPGRWASRCVHANETTAFPPSRLPYHQPINAHNPTLATPSYSSQSPLTYHSWAHSLCHELPCDRTSARGHPAPTLTSTPAMHATPVQRW